LSRAEDMPTLSGRALPRSAAQTLPTVHASSKEQNKRRANFM
jgi:hypothetical protein